MKSKFKQINSFAWRFATICLLAVLGVACSDSETTDTTRFTLYYTGLTDIGPSMSGTIASPTYKGSTPYDFVITNVTLNGEQYNTTEIFEIDSNTGAITLTSAKNTPVGLFKISVSCYSDGKRYDYADAIEVNMMKPVPDGIIVEPNWLETDYENIINNDDALQLPTAHVKTDGNHISITGYKIASVMYNNVAIDQPNKYFTISNSGEFSIVKGNTAIKPGVYTISLRLITAAVDKEEEEGIFENAIQVNITSKPLSLVYTPNEGKIEEETAQSGQTTFTSSVPEFVGSLEEIQYSISKITPATEKIQIDATTGVLTVATGHQFAAGENYVVNVKVANKFAPEGVEFEECFTLSTVEYINPVANFTYSATKATQAIAFSVEKAANFIGDEVWYEFVNLPEELKEQINIGERDGIISAVQGNTIKPGTYSIQVKASNTKNEEIATLVLTVEENPNYFTYIRYGNNLGLTPVENYANQFRVASGEELTALKLTPETDLKPGVSVKWEITSLHQSGNIKINDEGVITTASKDYKAGNCGIALIEATAGNGPTAVTVKTPIFFRYSSVVSGVTIEYTPFVLQANPRKQTRSVVPVVTGTDDLSKIYLDYRRTFNYYNINGATSDGVAHGSGVITSNTFLQYLWDKCEADYSTKFPISYYSDTKGTIKNDLTNNTLAYVDNTDNSSNRLSVVVNANQWEHDGWANGCFIAQMTFVTNGNVASINSGSQIFPLVIWLDTKF